LLRVVEKSLKFILEATSNIFQSKNLPVSEQAKTMFVLLVAKLLKSLINTENHKFLVELFSKSLPPEAYTTEFPL
jgi:phage regulator Rha-like protein